MTRANIFDGPFSKLREWSEGQDLSAKHLSEPPIAINKMLERVRPPRGITVPPVNTLPMEVFRVDNANLGLGSHSADVIRCKRMGESGELIGDPIYVAKPYLLRRQPFDLNGPDGEPLTRKGVDYFYFSASRRNATGPAGTISEVITPSYSSESGSSTTGQDQIVAMFMPNGVPGENNGTTITYPNAQDTIVWLDINVDGRAWAKEAD